MSFLLLELTGFLAGFIASLTGLGAGLVIVPIISVSGFFDLKEAIAMSAVSNVAISCSAVIGHIRRHVPNLRIISFLEIFAIAGSVLGAFLTLSLGKNILFLLISKKPVSGFWRQRSIFA